MTPELSEEIRLKTLALMQEYYHLKNDTLLHKYNQELGLQRLKQKTPTAR